MEHIGLQISTILDVYTRVYRALGFRKVILVGGAAIKLLVNSSRIASDIDVLTDFPYSYLRKRTKALELDGFRLKLAPTVQLIDNKTQVEMDFGYKKDFSASVKYLGIVHKEINSKAVAKKFGYKGKKVDVFIMSPEYLLSTKLQLLLLRGRSESKRRRDKEDIINILNKFY